MKQGLFTVTGLSIIALLIAFFPANAPAEENTAPKETKEGKAPQEQEAQKPAPEQQSEPQKAEDDQTWKEQLEQKHVEFIEWLQENYANIAEGLLANRDKKPEEFVQQLTEVMAVYEPIQRADRYSPELAAVLRKDLELQDQRDQMICEIGRAAEQDRPALINRLREIVAARFDNIIQKKQLIYDHLRKRLEILQEKLEEQAKELEQLKADKEKSVEQRMKELIEQNEKINWK